MVEKKTQMNEPTDAEGGAIRKPRKRSPRKMPKIEEALEKTAQGGAIRKARKRSPKKMKPKIEEAIEKKAQGGRMRFHDPIHKHLHKQLSGRGGRLDDPYTRKKMHEVMKGYHPAVWHSYMHGRYRGIPEHRQYHAGAPIKPTRADPRPTIVDSGGSLSALTHSENGILQSFDTNFYHHFEMI